MALFRGGMRGLATSPRVSITRTPEGVAHVRLSRADKMNALDMDMFRALRAAALEVAADTSVRAVLLSGEGRAFCAGLDVGSVCGDPLSARANSSRCRRRRKIRGSTSRSAEY